ncbi:MAG: STAS domain-containing protein [Calditrichaeota bacterium]|nr:STAS domain-containing protein [Calditrichota bacterium]
MEGIQVSTHTAGSRNQISVIKVGGYIDTTTSSEVERALNSLLKQGRYNIIIDLSNVDYISSAGWGIFISEIKTIRENNGDLKLVGMIPDVYEIFELLEFHHILDVYDTVEGAVMKFEQAEAASEPSAAAFERAQAARAEEVAQASETTHQPERPVSVDQPTATRPVSEQPLTTSETQPKTSSAPVSLKRLPLEEKIKYIVSNYPDYGAFRINRRLRSPEFGNEKVGWFKVRSLLKKLNLDTRQKRQNFALRHRSRYSLQNVQEASV